MSTRANQVANLRLWLSAARAAEIAEFLSAMRDELSTRLDFDAANYVTRAVACLDARKLAARLSSATAEPPARV